eukprot:3812823-Alexandrium_andersonii.AAC.1
MVDGAGPHGALGAQEGLPYVVHEGKATVALGPGGDAVFLEPGHEPAAPPGDGDVHGVPNHGPRKGDVIGEQGADGLPELSRHAVGPAPSAPGESLNGSSDPEGTVVTSVGRRDNSSGKMLSPGDMLWPLLDATM